MPDSEKKKMLAGELYHAGDREIQADQATAKAWMVRYNALLGASAHERRCLLRELLGEVGSDPLSGRHFIATSATIYGLAMGYS